MIGTYMSAFDNFIYVNKVIVIELSINFKFKCHHHRSGTIQTGKKIESVVQEFHDSRPNEGPIEGPP